MSMLFMTVRTTSNGLIATVEDGTFQLVYPIAGWLDFLGANRFKAFCKKRGLATRKDNWGKERVIRAAIGSDAVAAVDEIDACFAAVFGESGGFGLELRGLGWQPSNNSLEGDAIKPSSPHAER